MDALKCLWRNKQILLTLLTPVVLLPIALQESQVAKTGYGLLVIAVYWISESLPISVTALMPLILFPMLGVIPIKVLASEYFKDITFMFFGGLGVALGIEQWNLHKRFALGLLRLMGTRQRWVLLSLMLSSYFISLWISNTATTTMMLPVSLSLCNELLRIQRKFEHLEKRNEEIQEATREEDVEGGDNKKDDSQRSEINILTANPEDLDPKTRKFVVLFTLCIAYSATTGGSASLTGTGTNLITKDLADEISNGESGLSFTTWFIFSFPVGLLNVLILWVWLQILFCGPRSVFGCGKKDNKKSTKAIKELILHEYRKLGPVSFAEVGVLGHFLVLVVLWLTYDSEFFDGWRTLFKPKYVSNSTPAIIVMVVMFIFPSTSPFRRGKGYDVSEGVGVTLCGVITLSVVTCLSQMKNNSFPYNPCGLHGPWMLLTTSLNGTQKEPGTEATPQKPKTLLNWYVVQHKMPWGMLILIGCGFSVAKVCTVSGMSDWLGEQAQVLEPLPHPLISFLLNLIISFFTEINNNAAAVAITQPIVLGMAKRLKVHPLYFMMPSTFGGNFAYMLPSAGIPNAIAFSYGVVRVTDMIKAGFVMNLTSCLVVALAINTWGMPLFHLDTFPVWAQSNSTAFISQ